MTIPFVFLLCTSKYPPQQLVILIVTLPILLSQNLFRHISCFPSNFRSNRKSPPAIYKLFQQHRNDIKSCHGCWLTNEEAGSTPIRQKVLVLLSGISDGLQLQSRQCTCSYHVLRESQLVPYVRGGNTWQRGSLYHWVWVLLPQLHYTEVQKGNFHWTDRCSHMYLDVHRVWQFINKGFKMTAISIHQHTGCFTTCGHYCRRWFPRSLWSKKFI